MAADTDFNALYAELGVDADCDIAQFRLAYRRRVGSLHPDRMGGDDGLVRLQRLNRSYAQASEFHRLHGRLPGSRREAATAPAVPAHQPADAASRVAGPSDRARYSLVVAVVTVALLWLYHAELERPRLELGMTSSDVRALQGAPTGIDGSRWHYGPSWIEFRCGKVADWYSTPPQSLRVDETKTIGGKPLHPAPAPDCWNDS